ncbi:MAG: hypothetical protein ABSD96_11650, partial [Candidatus Korobacteraceae bacterium]
MSNDLVLRQIVSPRFPIDCIGGLVGGFTLVLCAFRMSDERLKRLLSAKYLCGGAVVGCIGAVPLALDSLTPVGTGAGWEGKQAACYCIWQMLVGTYLFVIYTHAERKAPHQKTPVALDAVVLTPVSLFIIWFLLFRFVPAPPRSEIVDFRPTSFQAIANNRFFYSIGDELKYSDQIDPEAPTLLHGHINSFLVAPDGKTIAVVVNGQPPDSNGVSVIVNEQLMVVSIYRGDDSVTPGPKPIGHQFFRDDNFQWSKDSANLYLIKDEFYKSLGSLYSEKAELWKYEVKTGDLELFLKPFPAYHYFFGLKSGIYFFAAENGKVQLRYFDGQHVTDVGEPDSTEIPIRQLAAKFVEKP